jgi:hypothetical protein
MQNLETKPIKALLLIVCMKHGTRRLYLSDVMLALGYVIPSFHASLHTYLISMNIF